MKKKRSLRMRLYQNEGEKGDSLEQERISFFGRREKRKPRTVEKE